MTAWTIPSSPLRPQLRREMRSRSWISSCEGYSPEQGPGREGRGLHQTSGQSQVIMGVSGLGDRHDQKGSRKTLQRDSDECVINLETVDHIEQSSSEKE